MGGQRVEPHSVPRVISSAGSLLSGFVLTSRTSPRRKFSVCRFLARSSRCLAIALAGAMIAARNGNAHHDPGTDSYILQLLLAVLLGVAFVVKMFWFRVKTLVANFVCRKPEEH